MFVERTSVGLDVHARSVVAAAIDGVTGELVQARLTPSHEHIRSWLGDLPGPVAVAYEAGPTGFGLARSLTAAGIRCEVVAPSKLQRPSGDRVKTDAKDAVHLARLLRLDEFTPVSVPTVEQETARDLVRAREDARADLMRARHRLSKLLLRQGIVYSGGQAWTGAHDAWLRGQRFDSVALQLTFESDYDAVLAVQARRDRLDTAITAMAADSQFTPLVHRLGCLRGIGALTGFALAVEIGDWHRFTGNTIGSFVGLVPSEYSSGQSRVQGSITKTGNTHVRRLLIEAAWHHRARYVAGKTMRDRWELASPAARARGDAGNRRLHDRWDAFRTRRKRHVVANVAIARELAGWCWSLAVLEE
ncbi:IS110 family transposase [Kribbella sp. NBC_01510]|uniref:IS110 family transposase n=1 Tax=Kribbella sp. NBC_01510 TaxID=2903581 RepID=UPI00386F7AAF